MPADTSILTSFRPAQIESPDVQNARAAQLINAQQQNMLGAMQLADRNREQQMNVALNQAYKDAYRSEGGLDTNLLREKLATGGFGAKLPALEKQIAELEEAKLKRDELKGKIAAQPFELSKKQSEAVQERLKQTKSIYETLDPTDPNVASKYLAIHNGVHDDPILGPLLNKMGVKKEDSIADINRAATTPQGMQDLINRSIMGTQKFMEFTAPKYEFVDIGGKKVRVQINPNAPDFNAKLVELIKTPTIGEQETARHNKRTEGIQGAELRLKQEKATQERDPAFQQAMAGAKARGEAIAKGDVAAVQALPKILDRANRSITLIDELVGKQEVRDKSGKVIQQGTAPHPGFNSAVGATLLPGASYVPGTDASDFKSRFEEIKGAGFLEAFESLKGAGSISEKEGEKATTAITRMSLAQSEKEFVAAARDFQDIVRKGAANAQKRASQAGAAPNVDVLLEKYK